MKRPAHAWYTSKDRTARVDMLYLAEHAISIRRAQEAISVQLEDGPTITLRDELAQAFQAAFQDCHKLYPLAKVPPWTAEASTAAEAGPVQTPSGKPPDSNP